MIRKRLIENYRINQGTLLEDFSDMSNWLLQYGDSQSIETEKKKVGSSSIRLRSVNAAPTATRKTITRTFVTNRSMTLRIYVPDPSSVDKITLYFSSSTTFASYFMVVLDGFRCVPGWNEFYLDTSKFTASGGESWANTMVRAQLRVVSKSGTSCDVIFDGLYSGEYNRPKLIFTMDDNWLTQYTEAYTRMSAKGLRGTIAVIPSKVDTSGYMTKAQLQEVYDAGWDLANHTMNHVYLGQVSKSENVAEIGGCTKWLNQNGFTRASDILIYPYGSYNDTTIEVAKSFGIKAGRTVVEWVESPTNLEPFQLKVRNCIHTVTQSTAISWIDEAIRTGGTTILLFHKIESPATVSMQCSVEVFQALVDYAYKKRLEIDTVTLSEWYRGLINPRKSG
jgi:peptidoglycan/xylan/chitin deacetylase (PgdA/CDA1 family)